MSIDITMPRLSDTMESGTLLKWNVAEGDEVSSGDVVADVETDKATMELTVFDDGKIAKLMVAEGATVDVGTVIAVLAEDGEDFQEDAGSSSSGAAPATATASSASASSGHDVEFSTGPSTATLVEAPASASGRLRISPVARRLADEHKVDVGRIKGSGPSGRIIKRDVLEAVATADETAASVPPSAVATGSPPAASSPAPASASKESGGRSAVPVTQVPMVAPAATTMTGLASGEALAVGRVPVSNMRQTIARRLVESSTEIPHYQVSMTFNMDPLLDLRKTLNEQLSSSGVKLSVNDFLVRACALSMYQHVDFNASWGGDAIIVHREVNIGVAISMGPERGGGLVVGVIRNADQKSMRVVSLESKYLAEKARTRGLSVEEMSDSTFTISNLGMFGVDNFTAIINPPNSAILAVGAAAAKPVVRDGELTIGHEMSATLSSDHRVIDGAMAAKYLLTLKGYIETPGTLLV